MGTWRPKNTLGLVTSVSPGKRWRWGKEPKAPSLHPRRPPPALTATRPSSKFLGISTSWTSFECGKLNQQKQKHLLLLGSFFIQNFWAHCCCWHESRLNISHSLKMSRRLACCQRSNILDSSLHTLLCPSVYVLLRHRSKATSISLQPVVFPWLPTISIPTLREKNQPHQF